MIHGRSPRGIPANDLGNFFRPLPRGSIDDARAGRLVEELHEHLRLFAIGPRAEHLVEEVFAGKSGDENLGLV